MLHASFASNEVRLGGPGRVSDDPINALAWVVLNRARNRSCQADLSDPENDGRVIDALKTVKCELRSEPRHKFARLPHAELIEAAVRSLLMDDLETCEDPTGGAMIFHPHWINPPDADQLRATALIGPFVFFTRRDGTA